MLINPRVFIGWLLGSAALHVAALGFIPYAKLSDGLMSGDTVQVRLSRFGNVNELAIERLGEAPGMETPETLFPRLDATADTTSIARAPDRSTLNDDAGFSSLRDAFDLDERVIASLDVLSNLVVDGPASPSDSEMADLTLAPPESQPLNQHSDLEPVVSLGSTLTAPSAEIPAESFELPVPIARPGGQAVEMPQPVAVASASTGGTVGAASSSNEISTTGESITSTAPTDLGALVSLLHEEIARHKQYPSLAKRQHREGTATVSFALYPDGAIDEVNVVSSSGFGRLDKAALYAVSEAAPFEAAENYLDRARHFKVNIVFSLQ